MNEVYDQRESTAYHEAGHAVVYVLTGHRFRYVTLRPRDPRFAGHVVSDCLVNATRWLDESAAAFAGLVAEDLYRHDGWADRRARESDRKTMVRWGARDDLRVVRDFIRDVWHHNHHEPAYRSATPIPPGWTTVDMAKAAWGRAVWLTVGASDAVGEMAHLLLKSSRAITWKQAREVVRDCEPIAVSTSDLIAMDLLRPWFLDHSLLSWEPQQSIVRLSDRSVAARGKS